MNTGESSAVSSNLSRRGTANARRFQKPRTKHTGQTSVLCGRSPGLPHQCTKNSMRHHRAMAPGRDFSNPALTQETLRKPTSHHRARKAPACEHVIHQKPPGRTIVLRRDSANRQVNNTLPSRNAKSETRGSLIDVERERVGVQIPRKSAQSNMATDMHDGDLSEYRANRSHQAEGKNMSLSTPPKLYAQSSQLR